MGDAAKAAERTDNELARVHVVRRAVFARDLSVWAYELTAGVPGRARALAEDYPLLNAIAELGVKPLVADKLAIVTIDKDTMQGSLPLPSGNGTIVLDLFVRPGDVDDALIDAVDERLDDGFQLALSGALGSPEVFPLVRRANLLRLPQAALEAGVLEGLKARPKGQSLWIEGVDQPEDFPRTRKYGPHYFSGDFLLKPSPVERRRAPRNLAVLMELMTALRDPEVRFSEVEKILRKDAGLSVTLLRFLNSAGFGLRVQVSTIRQAVALLGIAEFSKWVTLIGLGEASTKPNEVLVTALIRAKACELLAAESGQGAAAFMVGLFSLLDAMMDQPLEKVLEDLPVSETLRSALLDHMGFEGELLAAVLDHERGLPPETMPAGAGDLYDCWRAAVRWADALRANLPSGKAARPTRTRRRR